MDSGREAPLKPIKTQKESYFDEFSKPKINGLLRADFGNRNSQSHNQSSTNINEAYPHSEFDDDYRSQAYCRSI